jgi:hypothetical protein
MVPATFLSSLQLTLETSFPVTMHPPAEYDAAGAGAGAGAGAEDDDESFGQQ